MLQGFLGKKIGMTQIFREDGRVVPVTVVEAGPCVVTQVKTKETDGYEAVQLGFGEVKRRNKPLSGHLKNSRLSRYLREVATDDTSEFEVGQTIGVDIFEAGEKVDVIGTSKGRGFAGVMKRWNFGGGRGSHGSGGWRRSQDARSVRPDAGSGFHRWRHHPWQGLQRPEDGRSHGQPPDHGQRT